jgi:hypothetical protein
MTKMSFTQVPAIRDISGGNFSAGSINFRFTCGGSTWWIPANSYIRMRASLTKAGGAQLVLADGIAPNMNLMSNLFQSGEFRIQDKTVSRIGDYFAQIDTLENRMSKSRAWMQSVGYSSIFMQDSFEDRLNYISADGIKSGQSQSYGISETNVGIVDSGITAASTLAITGNVLPDNTAVLTLAVAGSLAAAGIKAGDKLTILSGGVTYVGIVLLPPTATVLQLAMTTTIANVGAAALDAGYSITLNRSQVVNQEASDRVGTFEMTWKCPLSIFKIDHALPCGNYELVLNPQNAQIYKKLAIQSLVDKAPGVDFDFNIVDMYLMIQTVDGPRADNVSYLIDLEETRCQAIDLNSANLQQKNFDVSPSSYALTTCFQDKRAGAVTQYPLTKFKINAVGDQVDEDLGLQLNRMYVAYAGESKPSPDADPQFNPTSNPRVDYTTQRYIESIIQNGAYFDGGGTETINEWHNNGTYHYMAFNKDGADRSTRVNVNVGFVAGTPISSANSNLLLFDHARGVARVVVSGSQVRDVQYSSA